jgi:hypothetical protein
MPPEPRSIAASFMQWLAGEELLGNGFLARRYAPGSRSPSMIGHLRFVRDSDTSLHDTLRHVGYLEVEAYALVQAFRLMFPRLPKCVEGDAPAQPALDQAIASVDLTPKSKPSVHEPRPLLDWASWEDAVRLWVEDDATLNDPDAERVGAAWHRLFGEELPHPIGPELDGGDEFFTPYSEGRVVVHDYTRCHSIWQLPSGVSLRAKVSDG